MLQVAYIICWSWVFINAEETQIKIVQLLCCLATWLTSRIVLICASFLYIHVFSEKRNPNLWLIPILFILSKMKMSKMLLIDLYCDTALLGFYPGMFQGSIIVRSVGSYNGKVWWLWEWAVQGQGWLHDFREKKGWQKPGHETSICQYCESTISELESF